MFSKLVLLGIACFGSLRGEADYREVTRLSYDKTAVDYQGNSLKLKPEVKAKAFLSYVPTGSKILDLGCGPGKDAQFFIDSGYQVTGVDISPQMISLARRLVPKGEFIVSDIESLSLNAQSFDAVWASASLLHVSKQAMPSVLKQLHEALRSGGIFYVSMKKGDGEELTPDERYEGFEKFWNYVQENELADLLIEQGFEILEQNTHQKSSSHQTHPWISVICKKPEESIYGKKD